MRGASRFIGPGLALSLCAAAVATPSPHAESTRAAAALVAIRSPEEQSLPEVVERSMPAVVLVLNTRADKSVSYGAGFLVESGLVLTSQHVIAGATQLRAMLYQAGRASYTPMDGGLSRYLFENEADIVNAHRVAGDPMSDLAVLQIDADTTRYPTLPIARSSVRPGDRVLALGHPQETAWSFTQGIVGAIEQAAIQHDTRISHGSSGGPLLNLRGEVVGVNIAKVMSEEPGFAFARPISFAARYLGGKSVAPPALDQSTPAAAALSCWRAQEIGRVETGDCFDWETGFAAFTAIADEVMRLADPASRALLQAEMAAPGFQSRWTEEAKRHATSYFADEARDASEASAQSAVPPAVVRARAAADREEARVLRERPELRGIHADQHNPAQLKARLRLGIRVARVGEVGKDRAWVELAGRNPDDSIYRFSELYVKIGDRWLQRIPPLPEDATTLPSSFAPPLATYTTFRAHKLEKLLRHSDMLRSARSTAVQQGPIEEIIAPRASHCKKASRESS